jgi:hypothetical protein
MSSRRNAFCTSLVEAERGTPRTEYGLLASTRGMALNRFPDDDDDDDDDEAVEDV